MNRVKFFGVLLSLLTIAVAGCSDEKVADASVSGDNVVAEKITDAKTTQSVTVYKSPTCGCCGEWVEHIENAGFHALVKHPDDLNVIKDQFNKSLIPKLHLNVAKIDEWAPHKRP